MESSANAPFSLQFSRLPASLPFMRAELRGWLEGTDASGDEVADIVLASWEACANALEHPIAPVAAEISIDASAVAGTVCIAVKDSGLWLERPPRPERGLGLKLINGLMDKVEITRNGAGTVVLMSRSLATRT